ncbi:sensor histidine kinase [Sphingomonas baiyangensis]|uniref:sensor histidine kinase n=1 Tax=Sphingomonas baiyangensis TaxID=2572576 RepID=UPI00201621B5|nr:sensor histidine kinase [Sphingomonas baiyangensis]
MSSPAGGPSVDGLVARSRFPTGARVFLILSAALLPLALIALFASLQTTRTAEIEVRSQLRLAATESARALAIELVGNMTSLRSAADALALDRDDVTACARLQGLFAQQRAGGVRFAITDNGGALLCGGPLPASVALAATSPGALLTPDALVLTIASRDGTVEATAIMPAPFLATVSRPSSFAPENAVALLLGDETLPLTTLDTGLLRRSEQTERPIGIAGLRLAMTMRSAPITSPVLLSMLLPLLMWAAAAGIAWFVVDRLLIRPLRRLRTAVGAYRPGEELKRINYGSVPAQEIQHLGDTFGDIARVVRLHEAELAEGLVRQTKLTREVHHRVKNNLQVIASLINFHARGAESADASAAYASIQRRVDALAVVHRYHFAELEENRGVELRPVIGELASNLRATAPAAAARISVVIEVEPYLVSQDTAVAVAFLLTEIAELAIQHNPLAAIRMTLQAAESERQAILRVSSPALIADPELEALIERRYGRVMSGLARQLRSTLHHDPLVGAYEIAIPITGIA